MHASKDSMWRGILKNFAKFWELNRHLIFMLMTLEITRKHRYFVVKNITFIYSYKMEIIVWQEFSRLFLFKFFEWVKMSTWQFLSLSCTHSLQPSGNLITYWAQYFVCVHGFLASRGRTSTRVWPTALVNTVHSFL